MCAGARGRAGQEQNVWLNPAAVRGTSAEKFEKHWSTYRSGKIFSALKTQFK